MEISQTLIDFLTRQYLFQGLALEDIRKIAPRFVLLQFKTGEKIFKQGDSGTTFFILYDGRAEVTHQQGRRLKEFSLGMLRQGDYFGEEAALYQRKRSVTVTATENSLVLSLDQKGLKALLIEHPQIEKNLQAAAEGRTLSRKLRIDWLGKDEVVYLIFRKHPFFLWISLIGPVIFFIGGGVISLMGWMAGSGGITSQAIGGVLVGAAILWALWVWIDWGNDYYILTSQRVVRLDKVIGLYDSRSEAPLDVVTSSEVNSTWLGRVLGYGKVDVQTFTGRVTMDRIRDPYQFASFVDAHKNWAVMRNREQEVQKMAEDLSNALLARSVQATSEIRRPRAITPPAPPPKKPGEWRERLETLLKVRYERDGRITYRKHWLILISKTWQPLLANLAAWGLMGTALWVELMEGSGLVPLTVLCTLGPVLLLGLALWLLYHYVDWSNDRYIITPTQVLDIEKKPLGTENKKSANLDAQDFRVEHTRGNIINVLFDYGNVVVRIGQTQFTFDWVQHPDQVHQDVVRARDALMQRKKMEEAERERKRMIEWLVMYHEQSDKLTNPDALPPDMGTISG